MGLVTLLQGRRVYLDTNIFVYALNGFPDYAAILTQLFDSLEAGTFTAVTSELALAEVLVIPFRHNDAAEEDRCRSIFAVRPGFELLPVNMNILERMARMRAGVPTVRTPDAIHAATAQFAACHVFLTNDDRLKTLPGLTVTLLSEAATS
jgi:predicted nucleic acid-binding protein